MRVLKDFGYDGIIDGENIALRPGIAKTKSQLTDIYNQAVKGVDNTIKGITQTDIDSLFNQVKENPLLNEWDKITARQGLSKLFGEYGGAVPTEGELTLLNRVFGKEFTTVVTDKLGFLQKLKGAGYQLAHIPRSVMASVDFSGPFRQGLFLINHPKQFFGSFVDMFKAFGSEKSFKAINESIVRKPTFKLMKDAKLALTEMDNVLTQREEAFMSQWAEKIPLVRASGRAL